QWTQLSSKVIWKARHEHSTYVFKDRIWVAGGHAQPLSSEVWSLRVRKSYFASSAKTSNFSRGSQTDGRADKRLAPFFRPPAEFAGKFGQYKSPLNFPNGRPVKTAGEWRQRRQEILKTWHQVMGPWPALLTKPKIEYLEKERREKLTQHHVRLQV